MDSRIQLGNGLINPHYHNVDTTTNTEILGMKVFLRRFMDSLQMTRAFFQNHGEEPMNHIQSTASRTQLGNG